MLLTVLVLVTAPVITHVRHSPLHAHARPNLQHRVGKSGIDIDFGSEFEVFGLVKRTQLDEADWQWRITQLAIHLPHDKTSLPNARKRVWVRPECGGAIACRDHLKPQIAEATSN